MAYSQQDPTVYLDPVTSQYYTMQTIAPQNYGGGNNFMGNNQYHMGMGGYQRSNGNSLADYANRNNNYAMPITKRKNTGDISMVNKMMQNRQPYQYNVPTLEQMFPQMAMPMINFNNNTGGAGQFLGGLLGSSPMLSQANAAPASSGAGRFA